VSLALGANATFVARSVDVNAPHLKATLKRVAEHKGAAFLEILQNCNIFNDGAWEPFEDKAVRDDNVVELRHGEPLLFGKSKDRGIRMAGPYRPEVVTLGNGIREADLLVHDEQGPAAYAYMLSQLEPPQFPMPIGVFRAVAAPCFDAAVRTQIEDVIAKKGKGDLGKLLYSGDVWEVR
jgi:2-oxoglutarate ferredoxin oxidoreductase subunit beta